jgi:deoxyuridine 5''-triphosphate nucleotidohydrolase (dut)
MRIKVIKKSKHQLPEYSTKESAEMNLRTNLETDLTLIPLERILVPPGLFLEIPVGYKAQIRPRNGLAIKKGVTVLNSQGKIDADYRAEICIILVNLSKENFVIEDGESICQMIIAKQEKAELESVDILLDSERGLGGFDHTGKN